MTPEKKNKILLWSIFVVWFIVVFGWMIVLRIIVELDPMEVKVEIIDICHGGGGKGNPPTRNYKYKFQYNDRDVIGVVSGAANELFGEVGDSIYIICNKQHPKYSIYNGQNEYNKKRTRFLEGKEYYRRMRKESREWR